MIRKRLTYANVTATIALVFALGGGAYAASKIDGSQLERRSVAGTKLKRGTITGAEVNEASLGFLRGSGRVLVKSGVANPTSAAQQLLGLPGFGDIAMMCNVAANQSTIAFINRSGGPLAATITPLGGASSSTYVSNPALGATDSVGTIPFATFGQAIFLYHLAAPGNPRKVADALVGIVGTDGIRDCRFSVRAFLSP